MENFGDNKFHNILRLFDCLPHFSCTTPENADNQFRNILRLIDILPNFPFTTSETMCDN